MAGLAAREVAGLDLDGAEGVSGSRVALAESALVGMVLHERVVVALRRLAAEDASARYFGAARAADQRSSRSATSR